MKAMIVGASAGLGRALAEELARKGYDLLLVAGDERDLDPMVRNLRLIYATNVEYVACRIAPHTDWMEKIKAALGDFGATDVLMFPIGLSRTDDQGELAPEKVGELMEANLLGVMTVVAAVLPSMRSRNSGSIVGFGSIADCRGRSENVAYAAAKRGLRSYFESLRHLLADSNVGVHFYVPGYMQTQQSYGKQMLFPAARTSEVARRVIANLGRKDVIAYIPRFWALVALGVRLCPWPIFRKLKV